MSDDKRRYSKVYRRMWNDARFRALTPPAPNGQTLWQRLITGPELTNVPGVFMVGEAQLAEALGWDLKGFREAFAEVSREGLAKADWKARLVFVPKAIKYNAPESPNVIRSWRQAWDELPECALKVEAYRALRAFVEGLGEGFRKAFAEALPDPSANQEQEQEQEQDPPPNPPRGVERVETEPSPPPEPDAASALWETYRETLKRHRPKRRPGGMSDKDRKRVRTLLRDGWALEDLQRAVRGLFLSPHHLGQNDRGTEYLEIEYALRKPGDMAALADQSDPAPPAPRGRSPDDEYVDPALIDQTLAAMGAIQ